MGHFLAITVDLDIWDPEQFAAAALAQAIKEGIDPEDAANTYTVDNLGACAQMLVDPGESYPGCNILGTDTTEGELY